MRKPVERLGRASFADSLTGFWIALRASGMMFMMMASAAYADTPAIDPAACQALVNYHEPSGVEYQPGVDVDGHYVAPADLAGNASPVVRRRSIFR